MKFKFMANMIVEYLYFWWNKKEVVRVSISEEDGSSSKQWWVNYLQSDQHYKVSASEVFGGLFSSYRIRFLPLTVPRPDPYVYREYYSIDETFLTEYFIQGREEDILAFILKFS